MNTSSPENERTQESEQRDEILDRVLREWQPPEPSGALDRRILSDYRAMVRKKPLWQRFLHTSVRVPLPVAVAAVVLLFFAAAIAVRRQSRPETAPSPYVGANGPVQAAQADSPVVIHTDLKSFQPVSDVNVTVIGEQEK